jgi:3'-phosphoadenosine 5'-phosphosulfate (PAPS) 3'-phosphatase
LHTKHTTPKSPFIFFMLLGRTTAWLWGIVHFSVPLTTLSFSALARTASTTTMSSSSEQVITVNLLDVAAAAVASTVTATRWIRELTENTNSRSKADGSLVTDADGLAQGAIIQALHQASRHVRIVGEESAEEMAQHQGKHAHESIDTDLWQRCHAEVRMRYLQTPQQSESETKIMPLSPDAVNQPIPDVTVEDSADFIVDAKRVSIFVDPLDGTKSYTRGEYDCVSILIGVVLDNEPVFGVVGKPFGYTGYTPILDSECVTIFGGPLLKGVYVAGAGTITATPAFHNNNSDSNGSSNNLHNDPADLPKAVISGSRSQGVVHDFCVYLGSKGLINPQPMLISGAGEKSLRLILQHSNEALWFFPKAGTSLWDVAASDALLRALGGKLTDKYGNHMNYAKTRTEAENVDGVIACIDPQLHAECIRIFEQEEWQGPM